MRSICTTRSRHRVAEIPVITSYSIHYTKLYDDHIRNNSEVVGDYRKFEDRYGSENIPFFLEIEKLYKEYESELNKLIKQFNLPAPPSRNNFV